MATTTDLAATYDRMTEKACTDFKMLGIEEAIIVALSSAEHSATEIEKLKQRIADLEQHRDGVPDA